MSTVGERVEVAIVRDVALEVGAAPDGADSGAVLVADVFHPVGAGPCPTVVQRTPYGRAFFEPGARALAARGYHVVSQDCRGSGGSTGAPSFVAEQPDGGATGEWVAAQPWWDGRTVAAGASYLGFTALALAAARPPGLAAIAIQIFGSNRTAAWFPGGSFALDLALPWSQIRAATRDGRFDLADLDALVEEMAADARRLEQAFAHVPLGEADAVAVGESLPWYQEWMAHPSADDPHWAALQLTDALVDLALPTLLVDGWYDYQVPNMVADHHRLLAAGVPTRLVIGPWSHPTVDGELVLDEIVAWLDHHVKGVAPAAEPGPVRVFVLPDRGWRELPAWPPIGAVATDWHLHPGGRLAPTPAPASPPDRYVYDPADPTPSFGGTSLRPPPHSGPVDNRELEGRADVLTYTSDVLVSDLEVAGAVVAEVHLTSSTPHTDLFVRVCDVDPDGRSVNVCDALRRLGPDDPPAAADGSRAVRVELWDTACVFAAGHRVRVQVSSGAHPRYARNLGAGEPMATATTIVVAHQQVHHDPDHPSRVRLPVVPAR